jgi:late competence protein required for DNA uptake (superfamily II DNA/RNA helicase)
VHNGSLGRAEGTMKAKRIIPAQVEPVVITNVCEFCGQTRPTASTTFHGHYCRECIELSIEQDKASLRMLPKEYKKLNKTAVKKKLENAYEDLVRGL